VIQLLKWPTAAFAAGMCPGLARAAFRATEALRLPHDAPLFAGFALYLAAWWVLFRHRRMGTLFPTFVHELTHALFAFATGHRVTGLRASWSEGGRVTFRGSGNWLIFVAPYFFPLLVVVLLAVLALVPSAPVPTTQAMLGGAMAFHMLATWRETHAGQTDLQRVGPIFSAAFLPAANLLVLAFVLRFASAGRAGAGAFVADMAWWVRRLAEFAGRHLG
jgi:hypothetical protein